MTSAAAKRVAVYGGSFDPPHLGHLAVAQAILESFAIDEFLFMPAFHAPHKLRLKPTPAFDRYTMLCLATTDEPSMKVSRMEIELPAKPFTVETLARLKEARPDDEIFFVMGADSWEEITTWRDWENVLLMSNHIVMTRPGYEIEFDHVTETIRGRIRDMRGQSGQAPSPAEQPAIYFTDAVNLEISASDIRVRIRADDAGWRSLVPREVAMYVEKYQIYS